MLKTTLLCFGILSISPGTLTGIESVKTKTCIPMVESDYTSPYDEEKKTDLEEIKKIFFKSKARTSSTDSNVETSPYKAFLLIEMEHTKEAR